ncbi:MAG: TatD family hydrolase [Candidatus Peribacteraceae bacterium]|nr:TatD family hydrolase [Candidatus Peribacteraceae bacterium]
MIDSHCHLTAPEFSADVSDVIARAKAGGVSTLVTISDEMSDLPKCRALAEKHDNIYFTVGTHPHHAKDFDIARDIALLREAAKHPKCKGIGEIGLDYHYMNSPKDIQQRVFESQLQLARELSLPAVVHCREAVEDVWTIVNHVKPEKLVIHCCTEKWQDVERFVKAGYLLSFTGIVTYPKASDIRETVKQCPLDRMMVETDAPFLSPVPYRGKRNEPAYVIEVAKTIAQIKGLTLDDVNRGTTQVARDFFQW